MCATLAGGCATEQVATRTEAPVVARPQKRAQPVDEDRDVGIQSEHGFIAQDEAEEAIRGRWNALVRCYREAGDATDYAGGAVKLRFQVDASGSTSSVHVLSSGLGHRAVERCLVGVARSIRFPKPEGNAAAEVEYSLVLRASGEIAVKDVPPESFAGLRPALYAHLATTCQRLGVAEVTATLYVNDTGTVMSAGLASATAVSDDTLDCVAGALQSFQAPGVSPAGVARVTLPLREADVLNPPEPERPRNVRLSQGRRAGRRR